MSSIHSASLLGFGSKEQTANYEQTRPSYPAEAVDYLIQTAISAANINNDTRELRFIDLGAGTGKFTRLLQERIVRMQGVDSHFGSIDFIVTAVEPVEGMRQQFVELSDCPIVAGSGSDLSHFESGSIDAIFCAQAFHWCTSESTLVEMARVLKPNGVVGLIWNTRDRRVEWIDDLEALIDTYYTPDVPSQQTGEFRRLFQSPVARSLYTPLEEAHLRNGVVQSGDLLSITNRVQSISVIAKLDANEKAECARKIKELLQSHPSLRGKQMYDLVYETEFYWCRKLKGTNSK